jgi:regulator of replication initiation timing
MLDYKDERNYVKVLLPLKRGDYEGRSEGIWVLKVEGTDNQGVGFLANEPFEVPWVKFADIVVWTGGTDKYNAFIVSSYPTKINDFKDLTSDLINFARKFYKESENKIRLEKDKIRKVLEAFEKEKAERETKINGISVDKRIAEIVKKFNDVGFTTTASCEGHIKHFGKLSSYVSITGDYSYNKLWNLALKYFTPYGRNYPKEWQYRPVKEPMRDKGNGNYNFIKKFDEYLIELIFFPDRKDVSITVIPYKNIDVNAATSQIIKHDYFYPSISYTGKKPSQQEWDSIRNKAFNWILEKVNLR